jgi:DNA-binding CsgD family transcriptional regulator
MSGMSSTSHIEALERGRDAYARKTWGEAFESLTQADAGGRLVAEDLRLLAESAFMLGRDGEFLEILERAHHAYLEDGEALPAVRCAFWIGMNLALRGEVGPASGWLGRAQRLLEREEHESVEHGYMLLPRAFQLEQTDRAAAAAIAGQAAAIGERMGDRDLFALALSEQGMMLVTDGRLDEGLALLDEAMVAVVARELSPIVSGIVYCGVILACQEVYEVRRAKEWTAALTRWAAEQPDLVAFTGRCLVHRSQILQLQGSWTEALDEARKASERFALQLNPKASAVAFYRQGELLRLQGDFSAAEDAYREASRHGWEPQPGLAQLRLAQGRPDAAAAAIRRAVSETADPVKRAALLPAYVEITLAIGEVEEARTASAELDALAEQYGSAMLGALAAHARGAVALAEDDVSAALGSLRVAERLWQELEAPYEEGRARVLIGLACRLLGDDDAAELELETARAVFTDLGAGPDLANLESLAGRPARTSDTYGLTARELEVLRLVAAGKSNRDIAGELVISEHTVARHVQNIFAKLDVSSRAAAGAFAFRHGLV